jgi:hypothetical protein
MNGAGITQLSLTFRRFLGKNMTAMRVTAFKSARCGLAEALGRASVCFNFWHFYNSNR